MRLFCSFVRNIEQMIFILNTFQFKHKIKSIHTICIVGGEVRPENSFSLERENPGVFFLHIE